MTEEYIRGYLMAVSRVKDLLTPHLGGVNQFFSIPQSKDKDLPENIKAFIIDNRDSYTHLKTEDRFQGFLNEIQLEPIHPWGENLQQQIASWTCDKELAAVNGKNGFYLSEFLIMFLLKDLFKNGAVNVYRMLPSWGDWHWADHMSEEFVFETNENIYILHFGESS